MTVLVRPARPDDAASIVDLLNPIIEAGSLTVIDEPCSVDDQLDFMRGLPERAIYHVAVDGEGAVVGIQDVVPSAARAGEISTFVAFAAQRRGVGRALCAATFEAARALGYPRLVATIRADNHGAIAFYLSQGFQLVGAAPPTRGLERVAAERLIR